MKKQYRYFEPLPPLKFDKNRFRVKQCPCGKSNKDGKFSPYVGYDDKGKCYSCGEKFLPELPKKEDTDNYRKSTSPIKSNAKPKNNIMNNYTKQTKEHNFSKLTNIFKNSVLQSLQAGMDNYLSDFLLSKFDKEIVQERMGKYYIGSSSACWRRATMFWLIDIDGKIRSGKIMLYNPQTGKRVKEPKNCINWEHIILKLEDFTLDRCLFGEHLLRKYPYKIVAIVESEKTALIASIYFPEFIWLATGGISNLIVNKCKVLEGRIIILYPDLNAYDNWAKIAKELSIHIKDSRFTVSSILEERATEEERNGKLDLADYLLRFDYNSFISQQKEAATNLEEITGNIESGHIAKNDESTVSSTDISIEIATSSEIKPSAEIIISLDDVIHVSITNQLTKEFNEFQIITMQLSNGKYLDCLFDKDGEHIQPNAYSNIVNRIEDFFNKKFISAIIDEHHCLINWYTEPPKTDLAVAEKSTVINHKDDIHKNEPTSTNAYTSSINHRAMHKDWTKDIEELEQYFNSIILPTAPIGLSQGMTITDTSAFIRSHLAAVKANNGNPSFLPYLDRLKELKKYLASSFVELLT